jgi:dienelactone hydrolase
LLANDYLDDTSAGLSFLRSRSDVNASRMSIVGQFQGGQLALLAAERDSALRAVVSFAPAALAWDNASDERRQALISVAGGIESACVRYLCC